MGSPRESFLPQSGLGGPGGSDLSARFQVWTQKLSAEMFRTFRAFPSLEEGAPPPPRTPLASGTATVYLECILQGRGTVSILLWGLCRRTLIPAVGYLELGTRQ